MQSSFSKKIQIYLQNRKQSLQCLPKFIFTIPYRKKTHFSTTHRQKDHELWPGGDLALIKDFQILISNSKVNGHVLVYLVRVSERLGLDLFGQQLHGYVLRSGFISNVFVSTALLNFYRRNGLLSDAQKLFVDIPEPSVVSYNSLISGYLQSGQFRKALILFTELDRSFVFADAFSLTLALVACGKLNLLELGQSIHSMAWKLGLECIIVVSNCLIDMYGKCGSFEDGVQVFDKMTDRDIISWNSVIAASARNKQLDQALSFLHQMPHPDTISYNELINGFAQFGDIQDAIEILSNMLTPNSSSWNSIITGYVNRGKTLDALNFFTEMHSKDIEMDQFTFSSILSGVAALSALKWGMLIHCCILKCGLDTSVVVGTSLIDMYSKCGQVNIAESIFEFLPEKNLISWNAMLSGFAHNGKCTKVINLFEKLKSTRDMKADEITFLNVLSAFSHNQMPLQTTIQYIESMIKDYGVNLTVEHCCTMIRILGQRGEVCRGERIIYELGFESRGLVWRALLGACGACRDLKVAEIAAAKMIELEGEDEYVYVVMSNIYASYGRWKDVRVVREIMRRKGMRKEAGCSWIEVGNYIPSLSTSTG